MQSRAKSSGAIVIIHPGYATGTHLHRYAVLRRYLNGGGQPSLRPSLSMVPRQMTWHWKITRNRIAWWQTDGFVDRCVFRVNDQLSHRAAPRCTASSRYQSVHVRGVADEWSRSPRYGPVTRDVIYNPLRWGGRSVRHQAGHSLFFLFFPPFLFILWTSAPAVTLSRDQRLKRVCDMYRDRLQRFYPWDEDTTRWYAEKNFCTEKIDWMVQQSYSLLHESAS